VAGGGGEGPPAEDDPHPHPEGRRPCPGHEAARGGAAEDAEGGAPSGEDASLDIAFQGVIRFRRIRIEPAKKREEYIERLERVIALCEEALTRPGAVGRPQLRAAEVLIKALRASYEIVREVDVENLERLAEEVARKIEEASGAGGGG
jgi:DNA-binding Lrp family transcriptional regulator